MSSKKNTIFNYFKKSSSPSSSVISKSASITDKKIAGRNPGPPCSGDASFVSKQTSCSKRHRASVPVPNAATEIVSDGWEDDDLDPDAVDGLMESVESSAEKSSLNLERPRKRIRRMILSDEEDEMDKDDDDIGDPDFDLEKVTDTYLEASSEEETEDIKEEVAETFRNKVERFSHLESPSPSLSAIDNKENSFSTAIVSTKLSSSSLKDRSNDQSNHTLTFPHLRFSFLSDKGLKDKAGRRPDHPDYNESTLHVPESFLKDQTPAHHQWWKLKADHFDTLLFFKMGKFYELFHMDAVIAVEKCGLTYMKAKEYAHCGFPEIGFAKYADMLVNIGYKVARIEQTENPIMMEFRCKSMNRPTKYDKVVKREICQISSQGTRTGFISDSELRFLTSVSGIKIDGQRFRIGICFVDTSVGAVHLSSFVDDASLSKLETMLAMYPPSELLHDPKKIPPSVFNVLSKFARNCTSSLKFPDAKKALKMVNDKDYFGTNGDVSKLPNDFKVLLDDGDVLGMTPKHDCECVLSAFGGVVCYLQVSLIDDFVLSTKKVINVDPIDVERTVKSQNCPPTGSFMILDCKTIRNLDLVTDKKNSMFAVLNKTQTPMGRRLLKQWLCSPLLRSVDVVERQNAIKYLGENKEVADTLKAGLHGMPDIEKLLASIHMAGVKLKDEHPESRAIYYEQTTYSARKISRLVTCLNAISNANQMLKDLRETFQRSFSKLIKDNLLFEVGALDLDDQLKFFSSAFNQETAFKEGKMVPKRGVDEAYDDSQRAKRVIEKDIKDYLLLQKQKFGCDIKYFGSGNSAFQLEIPEQASGKVDGSYTLSSQRKGFKRFVTEETKNFLKRRTENDEAERSALAEVSRNIFSKFSSHSQVWDKIVSSLSFADALLSLYEYSYGLDASESCFPNVVNPSKDEKPFLKIASGKHPIVIGLNPNLSFIPNDFELDERLAILTGANMGGKSTLMRQTALLVILSQMGCKVPASKMSLTPVDRIFTRIGAADSLFDRESTFFVELAETSVILKHANSHSLVLIDELGRGTTTFDGCAIAHAVSNYLLTKKCRTMFSTHYHELTREYLKSDGVLVYHMAVMEEEGERSIVFLYTVTPGPCSKSHGFNAAKLAQLPSLIVDKGEAVAHQFEKVQDNLMKLSHILQNY